MSYQIIHQLDIFNPALNPNAWVELCESASDVLLSGLNDAESAAYLSQYAAANGFDREDVDGLTCYVKEIPGGLESVYRLHD